MKTISILLVFIIFFSLQGICQTAPVVGSSFPSTPYSPMLTDPVKIVGTPYLPFWRNNLFKWYGNRPAQSLSSPNNWRGYDVNAGYELLLSPTIGSGGPYRPPNPFCDEGQDYTDAMRYGEASRLKGKEPDYLSADGWELVKQELGYLHHDNSTTSQQLLESLRHPVPYVMIYNKFSSVLRIMGYYQFSAPATGVVLVTLELNDKRFQFPNPSGNNFSGLFNTYGQTYTTLDKLTTNQKVQSAAFFPAAGKLFWADFQMAYDPCICFFNSYIYVDFQVMTQATLNAYGGSVSCNSAACPSPDEMVNYLSSFLTDPQAGITKPLETGQASYKSYQDMLGDFHSMVYHQQAYLEDKDGLWQDLQEYGEMAEMASQYVQYVPEYGEIVAQGLEALGKGMKFVGSTLESPLGKATKDFIAISGTVTSTTNAGTNILRLATPGSPWTKVIDPVEQEFSRAPMWPVYNEVFGNFAVLNKPPLKVFNDQGPYYVNHRIGCNNGVDEDHSNDPGRTGTSFSFDGSTLKYIFNPVLQLANYKIEAAVQITYRYKVGDGLPTCNPTPTNPGPLYSNLKRIKNNEQGAYVTATYETPYVNLGCTSNINGFVYYPDGFVFQSTGLPNFPEVLKYEIKLIVTGTSTQKNRFGTGNSFYQLYTIVPELIQSNDVSLTNFPSGTGSGYVGIPFLRSIVDYFRPANGTTTEETAIETMILSGNFTNLQVNSSGAKIPIAFSAGNSIEFNPGFEIISGEFEFKVESPFGSNCPSIAEQTVTTVTNFCKSLADPNVQPYKANSPFTREVVSNANVLPNPSATTLSYPIPNPTSGNSTISFNLAESSAWNMQLCNAMGVHLKTVGKKDLSVAGKYSVDIDTQDLEAGVYFITFTSEGFRQARKLVVVR